jgi:AmmeMemoRadiSam system protein B/AmmeMemoRadiSam system protein A
MFYPNDPEDLRSNLSDLFHDIDDVAVAGRPLALVAPHAGYPYSGRIAAHGYKLLTTRTINTAVIISPSHMEHFSHISVYDGDAYETPLGQVRVDKTMAWAIADADPLIRISDHGHTQRHYSRGEHALEVQLPFLQTVVPECRIVPIVMGDQSWEYCQALGNALAPHTERPDVIIVASSDLSHFYDYEVARKLDEVFLERLTGMDPRRLYESVKGQECEACGAGPVVAALIAAGRTGAPNCRVLSKANSGDVTGERDRVVGYASAVVLEGRDGLSLNAMEETAEALGPSEQHYLLRHARRSIETALGIEGTPVTPTSSPVLEQTTGGFITLKRHNRLRGCIGTIESERPLTEMIEAMAKAAAFEDPRFNEVNREEMDDIRIEISILSPLRMVEGPADIEVGVHGLVIEKDHRRGLLLPQVAKEHNWDTVTFLERTCEKAGLEPDSWTHADSNIYVFTATVFAEEHEIPT